MRSSWFVYIVRCRDASLYTGITRDVPERIRKHNAGLGAKYTQSRTPVALVWSAAATSESAAKKYEREIKGWSKARKEALVKIGSPEESFV